LQGFGDMLCSDALGSGEIGDRTGQLEHPVIAASRERQLTHGSSHELFAGGVEPRKELDFLRTHIGIGQDVCAREALRLNIPCFPYARANRLG